MADNEMRGFEDLECYKLALQVFCEAYRIVSLLPSEEKYNLADQLRRAVTSAILNIAEGYGRHHYLDSLRFYYIARGSIMETLSALIACDGLKYTKTKSPGKGIVSFCLAFPKRIYSLRTESATRKTGVW